MSSRNMCACVYAVGVLPQGQRGVTWGMECKVRTVQDLGRSDKSGLNELTTPKLIAS